MMDDEELDEVPKASKMPLIIASVVCLLLGGGAGFGAAQMFGGDESSAVAAGGAAADPNAEPAQTMDLGEFTVNLRNTAGGRMLQMNIAVLVAESALEGFAEQQAQMRDAILLMSSDYTVADLDGQDNKLDFRDEVLTRLNGVLGADMVRAVYLTRFVVQ
ncbi:MAG: flagellar FliL protein [Myxococcota bacterium]|jgi:flagellar FliL protein